MRFTAIGKFTGWFAALNRTEMSKILMFRQNNISRIVSKYFGICSFFLFALLPTISAASVEPGSTETEMIIFVDVSGDRVTRYWSDRKAAGESVGLSFDKSTYPTEKLALEEFIYIFPNRNQWTWNQGDFVNGINIQQNRYSVMKSEKLDRNDESFYRESNGIMVMQSRYLEPTQDESGNYGSWADTPNGFSHYVRSWSFPDYIEIVSYDMWASGGKVPKSQWEEVGNTITYFGQRVNNLTYEIKFRYKSTALRDELREIIGALQGVTVETEKSGVRISLLDTVLFDSGSADVKAEGRSIVNSIYDEIRKLDGDVIVSGHTDNVPITTQQYPTNWHLSAARALSVLDVLLQLGVMPTRCSLEAFGETEPRATNATAEGRAQNRRIEILIDFGES